VGSFRGGVGEAYCLILPKEKKSRADERTGRSGVVQGAGVHKEVDEEKREVGGEEPRSWGERRGPGLNLMGHLAGEKSNQRQGRGAKKQ